MAENVIETTTILKVENGQAVQSVADLRKNVQVLREALKQLEKDGSEEGWKNYQKTLAELKTNQNALRDAMFSTHGSFQDLQKSALGVGETYNSLVHQMASLKSELRATDVSTEEGRKNFEKLAGEINTVNNKLKEMDALQGNYQRNVGNYSSAFKDWSQNVDVLRKSLTSATGGLNGMKDGLEGLSKSPAIATFGILVSLAFKLADELKDNEAVMGALKKLLDAFRPVLDFLEGLLEQVAEFLADIIGKAAEFVSGNGVFKKIIEGVTGVGNAIFKFIIAPFKGIAAAIKVFQEEGVKGLGNAAKAFASEMKSGVAFKENYSAGQAVATAIISGVKSKKPEAVEAGTEIGKSIVEGMSLDEIMDEVSKSIDQSIEQSIGDMDKQLERANQTAEAIESRRLAAIDKAMQEQLARNELMEQDEETRAAREYAIIEASNQRKKEAMEQFYQDAVERGDYEAVLDYEQQMADLDVEIELNALKEKQRIRQLDLKNAEQNAKARQQMMMGLAKATSSILGTIADAYENDEKNAGKNAGKIKALRIASATIDTISGAIGAFMQAVKSLPFPAGAIVGAVQAAAVTASGIAQIAQIKNTKIGSEGESAASSASVPSLSAPSVVSAPIISEDIPSVRTITSASEEERLNTPIKAYVVDSELEGKMLDNARNQEETSF